MSEEQDFDIMGAFGGMLSFTRSLTDGSMEESRKDIFRDKWENILVDTCCPPDSGKWETGIESSRTSGHVWIAEQYPDRETARIGHEKWVKLLRENPNTEIPNINVWNTSEDEDE